MSVTPEESAVPKSGGMLGPANSVMSAIFDSVGEPEVEAPAEEGAPAAPPAGEEPAAPVADPAEPEVPDAPAEPGEEPPSGGAETPVRSAPPVVTADSKTVTEQFGKMAEALETRFTESFERQAVAQAQEDYPQYLDALRLHPLELIGQELPPIDGSDQNVTFRTAEEVSQWQDAVKTILRRELEASVAEKQQESNEILDVVHNSIQMFADNPDLVPGTKGYNKALASEFVRIAEPYALRMNGKLTGYSIPVQGLIDRVRAQVNAKPAAPAAPAPAKKAPASKPQAGIQSKAGNGGGKDEDFTPMWKALGIDSAPI